MKAQPTSNAILINNLQHQISTIQQQISPTRQIKSLSFYEDDNFAYEIDENGHEIVRIKANEKYREARETIEAQNTELSNLREENERLRKQLETLNLQHNNTQNKYKVLWEYIKPHQAFPILQKELGQETNTDQNQEIAYKIIEIPIEREVIVEVPVEIERVVFRQVQKQVKVEVLVETVIEVPIEIEKIIERILEVPIEKIVYVDRIVEVEKVIEVPTQVVKLVEVYKQIEVPLEMNRIVEMERIVEVEKIVEVERIVEVPVERIVERIIERQVPVQRIIEKEVERLVEVVIEKPIYIEKIIEVEKIIQIQRQIESEQLKHQKNTLEMQLSKEKEENQILRIMFEESTQENCQLKSALQELKGTCSTPSFQNQELTTLSACFRTQERNPQFDKKQMQQIQQLKEDVKCLEEENKRLNAEAENIRNLYEIQLNLNQENNLIIADMNNQILESKSSKSPSLKKSLIFGNNSNQKEDQNNSEKILTFSQSNGWANRVKILCLQSGIKFSDKLKSYLAQVPDHDIAEKISSIVYQISLNAQSHERANILMKEVVNQLKSQYLSNHSSAKDGDRLTLIQQSQSKLTLLNQISSLKRQNYQLKLQLHNQQANNQTEELIEHLTIQLQQERNNATSFEQQNQILKLQIDNIQAELANKNKRIKALIQNLSNRNNDSSFIEPQ